jgi:hypothetical protein
LFTCSEIVIRLSFYAEGEFSRSSVHATCMAYLTMSLADAPGEDYVQGLSQILGSAKQEEIVLE